MKKIEEIKRKGEEERKTEQLPKWKQDEKRKEEGAPAATTRGTSGK